MIIRLIHGENHQFKFNYYTLDELLNLKINDIELLTFRLEGETLEEIGKRYCLTRERVRQRLRKVVSELPKVVEVENHKEVFQTYEIPKNLFCNIFNKDPRTYELLNLLYAKGQKSIITYILEGNVSEYAKQFVLRMKNQILVDGKVMKITREYALRDLLRRYSKLQEYFTSEELYYLYCEDTDKEIRLQFKSARSMSSQIERYSQIVFSLGQGYRFHDIKITECIKKSISDLFYDIPEGAYSMNYMFEKNAELMKKFDLRSGSELHNFCKKYQIDIPNVILGRNPEFIKEVDSKKDFIFDEMKKFDTLSQMEFVSYVNENFGLNKESLLAYISVEFSEYIKSGTIIIDRNDYYEFEMNIEDIFGKEIYLYEEFVDIVRNALGIRTITPKLIQKLGYLFKGTLVVSNKYKSARKAVESLILSNRIFTIDDSSLYKTNDFFSTLRYLEKEYKLIKISKDTYLNTDFIQQKGYDIKKFFHFVSNVEKVVPRNTYFTITYLMKNNFHDSLMEDGFDAVTLDRLISTSDEIQIITSNFPALYFKGNITKNKNDFLIDMLFEERSINIEDFKDNLNDKFGLDLDEYDIRYRLVNQGAFYSKELNKIYIDKDDYLREVYGE